MNALQWANDLEVPGDPLETGCLQLRPQGSAAPDLPFCREVRLESCLLRVGSLQAKGSIGLAQQLRISEKRSIPHST